ncbi:AAA family ATPase, partial [uncultured Nocardioides sp.]|uniref:AAA family ATPase n=1 Tax=uncultured Nocardioides sp. TaxID=198441 RepID=UPI002634B6E2
MIEEIRIQSLGVIDSSTLELGPGLTVITGETGAGKTMVVTALGLLLGGRADSGAVRTGARTARVEGVVVTDDLPELVDGVEEAGGTVEDGRVVLARNVSAEGRSRAFVGGASVPVATLSGVSEPLVAVHGQSDQHRLLRPRAQRDALDRFGGEPLAAAAAAYRQLFDRLRAVEEELSDVVTHARERAREADLLRLGLEEVEAVAPQAGEEAQLAAEETRLGFADTLRAAAEQAREALSSEQGGPDAMGTLGAARTLLDCPIAHISVVEEDSQWYKSVVGMHLDPMPKDTGFCAHTIMSDAPMIVPDLSKDARFERHPMVAKGGPEARYYAGVPLILSSGHRFGSLCALDL